MTIPQAIAQHIYEVHFGGNWSEIDIKGVLQDVSFSEAITKTPASPNTIADILYHISFYSNITIQRLNGENPKIKKSNGFDLEPLQTETEWEQLKNANLNAASALSDKVKMLDEQLLQQPVVEGYDMTYYKALHGVAEHAYYHLGQIVILKNVLKNNVHL